jgi:outer membrane protein TolC
MRHRLFGPWFAAGGLALLLLGGATRIGLLPIVVAQEIEVLPPLRVGPFVEVPAPPAAPAAPTAPAIPANALPLSLDTVLHLAQDRNGQVQIARLRVEEACARQALADNHWIPEISVGPSYYRHEGGIQDFQGNLVKSSYGSAYGGMELRGKLDLRDQAVKRIEAARNTVQRRGDLSKLSAEELLAAASVYVDTLAARTGEAVALDTENRLAQVLVQARKLAAIDPGVGIEAVRAEAEIEAHKVLARKLREQFDSAKMKLLYSLGMPVTTEIALLDEITLFKLVDENQPAEALVDRALRDGPGVADLTHLLGLLDRLRSEADCAKKWIPTMEVVVGEGAFGAGPGSRLDGDNRFDAAVHFRWSLNDVLTSRDQLRILDNQRQQAHLTYQDLRAKLELGVRQALEELRSSLDQTNLATKHIQCAEESFRLSDQRLRENIKGRSPSEVLLAARSLFAARLSYLQALRDYDKAQLRLFVLIGSADCRR